MAEKGYESYHEMIIAKDLSFNTKEAGLIAWQQAGKRFREENDFPKNNDNDGKGYWDYIARQEKY